MHKKPKYTMPEDPTPGEQVSGILALVLALVLMVGVPLFLMIVLFPALW